MLREFSEKMKKELRAAAGLAYERELNAALDELEQSFVDWRNKKISPFELSDKIHEHHNGVTRELWQRYSDSSLAAFQVVTALNRGILKADDVSAELNAALADKREALKDFDD